MCGSAAAKPHRQHADARQDQDEDHEEADGRGDKVLQSEEEPADDVMMAPSTLTMTPRGHVQSEVGDDPGRLILGLAVKRAVVLETGVAHQEFGAGFGAVGEDPVQPDDSVVELLQLLLRPGQHDGGTLHGVLSPPILKFF